MPVQKINFFFKFKDFGWSETLYGFEANTGAALRAATNMVAPRVQLLGGGATDGNPALTEVRVSDIDVQRDSLIYSVPLADQTNHATNASTDNPQLCILLRVQSADKFRRQLYLRGQPDILIQNGEYVPFPLWELAFNRWVAAVIANPFYILALDRLAPVIITSVALGAGGVVTLGTSAPHGLVDQDRVRVTKAPGMAGVKGTWYVQITDATHFVLLGATGAGVYAGGGKYIKQVPTPQPITAIQIMRAGKRSTGGPFDRPHGRRRRKAKV